MTDQLPNNDEIKLSLEGLALANVFVTKQLISTLIAEGILTPPMLQTCFETAKKDLHRATLSISANEADHLLSLIWRGFTPSQGENPH